METTVNQDTHLYPKVQIFSDLEALSAAAAEFIATISRKVTESTGNFSMALSGGVTPRPLYALFGSTLYRERIDWKRVRIFWTDERCVPPDHPESNYKLAFDSFLSRVSIPPNNIHRIKGEASADQAARAYERDIRLFLGGPAFPIFDLIILGVGEDGHTASLFPASGAAKERVRVVAPVYLEPPKLNRVTLTLPTLNNAVQILFLVSGKSKQNVIKEIVEQGNPHHYPAGLVQPRQGYSMWFLDNDAANLLTQNNYR